MDFKVNADSLKITSLTVPRFKVFFQMFLPIKSRNRRGFGDNYAKGPVIIYDWGGTEEKKVG